MSHSLLRPTRINTFLLSLSCLLPGCVFRASDISNSNNSSTGATGSTTLSTSLTGIPSTNTGSTNFPDGPTGSDTPSNDSVGSTSTDNTQTNSSSDTTSSNSSSGEPAPDDPFLWLEEIDSKKAADWVRARNRESAKALSESAQFKARKDKLKKLLDAQGRIPQVQKVGNLLFNFWQDKDHPIGIWRRTTIQDYISKSPRWQTVLDLDKLAKDEKVDWVWKRADCLGSSRSHCVLALSKGGKDAVVHREFDAQKGEFVEDGFILPEAKGRISWVDENTLLVGTDFGAGTTTKSGYPRQIRRWTRGSKIKDAPVVFEGKASDNVVRAYHSESNGFKRDYLRRMVSRFESEHYLINEDQSLTKIDVPLNTRLHFWGPWILVELGDEWKVGDTTYPRGSVVVSDQKAFLEGKRELKALFTPSKGRSFQSLTKTRGHLLFTEMQDVKGRLTEWSFRPGEGWQARKVAVPESGSFTVRGFDENKNNDYTLTYSDYLTPPTLFRSRSGTNEREKLYSLPKAFDSRDLEVKQHFATSKDGTKIPYFQISKRGLRLDENNPTLLYGYGGFQVSLKPRYDAIVGSAWLEQGGVYVVANIRGGGEYGPAWHQAAIREKRSRAFEDFVAVGKDLVRRKVTKAERLGVAGRSNGGLLTGVMLTRYPAQWGAVVSQAPLLDMRRFHKLLAGALWRGEYGDPDVAADWKFISEYSPYQNIETGKALPDSLFTTSTKDDRVHPGHARKMVARLKAEGYGNAMLYENTGGGHSGASTNEQKAHLNALVYGFLAKKLGLNAK